MSANVDFPTKHGTCTQEELMSINATRVPYTLGKLLQSSYLFYMHSSRPEEKVRSSVTYYLFALLLYNPRVSNKGSKIRKNLY